MKAAPWLGLFVTLALCSAAPAQTARRPNVLFMMSDDLCAQLGCLGADVHSPNLDKLAARSTRFDRTYCQYPLCGPSRCSLLSGLRPDTDGVQENGPTVRHKIKDLITLPQLFRNNGYYSARVGKIYHLGIPKGVGTSGPDDPLSWDYAFNPKGAEFDTDGEEVDPNPKNGQSFRYVIEKGNASEQADYQSADEAIKLLRQHKDKPFFLAVGFIRPHVPEIAPKKYFDLYPLDSIKLPIVPPNDRDDIPAMAFKPIGKVNDDGMTPQQCRESIRAYRASTSFMDEQAGRVLDELDRLGLRDNTVIVFVSDHGYCLGQHHAWQKMMLFEPVCRVPMFISAPGMKPAVTTSLAEELDVYPTVAALCGLTPPKSLEGVSLVPVMKDPSATVIPAAYTQLQRARQGTGRSVRTERYRYTEWTKLDGSPAGAELYDEQSDPGEFTNLVKDSRHAGTVEQMKGLLLKVLPIKTDKSS